MSKEKELSEALRVTCEAMHKARNDYARGVGLRSEMERTEAAFNAACFRWDQHRAQLCGVGWTRMDSFM